MIKLRLISKITIYTNLVIIVVMTLFAYFSIKTMESALLRGIITEVDKMSETIIRSSHHQMLEGDLTRVYQMVSEVGNQKGIEVIRLINKNGRINFSTQEAEFGHFLDKKAEACTICHKDNGEPRTHSSSMNSSRLFTDRKGKQVLGLAKAIYNQESCYIAACHFHPAEVKILGVLDVVVSLESMNELINEYRNKIIALTIFLLAIISVCLSLLTQKLVNHPVRQLLNHTCLLAQGQLESEVAVNSGDELGELAESFNSMTRNLRAAHEELEDWGKTLEGKVDERTREIKRMQDHLLRSEKLASMGELVAGIAHELNNPLTGMLVFASLILKDRRFHPELHKDLELVIQETERCARIVGGLLNFCRESRPQLEPSSLNDLVEVTLSLIGNQSFFHNIVIRKNLGTELPQAFIDPNQVEQVLINIMVNAGQAMPEGGLLSIATGLTPDCSQVYVSISDTGCGIPEGNIGKIFDPFFSTKEMGTGLGLSLCYGIVGNNNGELELESTVGVGTTFTVMFPVHDQDSKNPAITAAGVIIPHG